MKITSLLFGIVFSALFMSSLGLVMLELSDNYDVEYNSSRLDFYNRINDTQAQVISIQKSTNESSTDTGVLDILGNLVTQGVSSLRITYNSLGTSTDMIEQSTTDLQLPYQYKSALITALFIFVVLGVIVSVLVKVPI